MIANKNQMQSKHSEMISRGVIALSNKCLTELAQQPVFCQCKLNLIPYLLAQSAR